MHRPRRLPRRAHAPRRDGGSRAIRTDRKPLGLTSTEAAAASARLDRADGRRDPRADGRARPRPARVHDGVLRRRGGPLAPRSPRECDVRGWWSPPRHRCSPQSGCCTRTRLSRPYRRHRGRSREAAEDLESPHGFCGPGGSTTGSPRTRSPPGSREVSARPTWSSPHRCSRSPPGCRDAGVHRGAQGAGWRPVHRRLRDRVRLRSAASTRPRSCVTNAGEGHRRTGSDGGTPIRAAGGGDRRGGRRSSSRSRAGVEVDVRRGLPIGGLHGPCLGEDPTRALYVPHGATITRTPRPTTSSTWESGRA